MSGTVLAASGRIGRMVSGVRLAGCRSSSAPAPYRSSALLGPIGDPQLYNPADGSFSAVPSSTMIFCSGHTFLVDGRLLVSGGHLDDRRGLRDTNLFDPASQRWLPTSSMSFARCYPTTTTMADGAVISLAGTE